MSPGRPASPGRWRRALLLAAGLLAASPALQAHGLRVFAFAEGGRIAGQAYFASGDPAPGARITVTGPGGEILARPVADGDGRFAFPVAGPVDHHIRANSRDGHQARWTVGAAEAAPGPAWQAGAAPGGAPAAGAGMPEAELGLLVEQAVARQVRPLREELLACQEQTRFRDVLGGLGYILGLAGLAAWWRVRRPGRAG